MPRVLPLRERRNISLSVITDRPVPRRTKAAAPTRAHAPSNDPSLAFVPDTPPPAYSPTLETTTTAPRQLIPHLFLSAGGKAIPPGGWTHVVRILPATDAQLVGSTVFPYAQPLAGPQVLTLHTLPPTEMARLRLPLAPQQLSAARDFLALALPYQSLENPNGSPVVEEDETGDAVRVLLIGPTRVLLLLAFTYIAYASQCSVGHVMRAVLEEREDAEVCAIVGRDGKMGLGKSELRVLEHVARG